MATTPQWVVLQNSMRIEFAHTRLHTTLRPFHSSMWGDFNDLFSAWATINFSHTKPTYLIYLLVYIATFITTDFRMHTARNSALISLTTATKIWHWEISYGRQSPLIWFSSSLSFLIFFSAISLQNRKLNTNFTEVFTFLTFTFLSYSSHSHRLFILVARFWDLSISVLLLLLF